MSTKIKIPKGWRRVRHKEMRKRGDRVWQCGSGPWTPTELTGVEYDRIMQHPLIRRIPKKRKKA